MYNAYFNLQEKPFKLVPDPGFLYLSKSHEIALAHLNYAVDQGDGFVVVTGEVGTGKTTLCRLFLEKLDANTESAYIFNPNLDSAELLAGICNEFGIRTQVATIKSLLDILNDYLILKNKLGRKVILLIDEAQNLTIENLEMVRMLSNLETTRQKLLQIILVGQPELNDKLDTYELRQLSQRISLGCHLAPLSAPETEKYIQHRLAIAAQHPVDLFTRGACRRIHSYATGIPRLVNIAADRALLTAFSLNRRKVTEAIAQSAIKEISLRGRKPTKSFPWTWMGIGIAAFLVFLLSGIWLAQKGWVDALLQPLKHGSVSQSVSLPQKAKSSLYKVAESLHPAQTGADPHAAVERGPVIIDSEAENSDQGIDGPPATGPIPGPATEREYSGEPVATHVNTAFSDSAGSGLAERLARLETQASRLDAVSVVLGLWRQTAPEHGQVPDLSDDRSFFEIAARQYGLRSYAVLNDWDLLEKVNMPAIVGLRGIVHGRTVYMTLIGRNGDRLLLTDGQEFAPVETDLQTLKPYLTGSAYLFWKNTFGFDAVIAQGSHESAVLALKTMLRIVGYDVVDSPHFDQGTRAVVMAFQQRHGIAADGLVGPLTKMLLILEANAFQVPRLSAG